MNNDILTTMKKDALVQIKITPELKEKLQAIADEQGITLSRLFIVTIAKQYPELVDIILKH